MSYIGPVNLTTEEMKEAARLLRNMDPDGGAIGPEEVELLARLSAWLDIEADW